MPPPLTAAELDGRIERWFADKWQATFDFEVDDGMAKLRRLRLVDDDGQGRSTAVSLDEAKSRLDETWDGLFRYDARSPTGHAVAAPAGRLTNIWRAVVGRS